MASVINFLISKAARGVNGIIMFVNERSQTEQQLKGLAFGLLQKIQPGTFSLN